MDWPALLVCAAIWWLGFSLGMARGSRKGFAKGATAMREKIDEELKGYFILKKRTRS